jgi:hypothetical protein
MSVDVSVSSKEKKYFRKYNNIQTNLEDIFNGVTIVRKRTTGEINICIMYQ